MNHLIRHALVIVAALLTSTTTPRLYAATFSDDNWSNIGNIFEVEVDAVATDSSGTLYVGGSFTVAGGVFANNIAKWNGQTWSALGSGIDGTVVTVLAVGNDLYAGGQFTRAGGVPATNIAKWNGTNWSALGSGVSAQPYYAGYVDALAMSGHDLYAAGYFTNAGGVPANYIAKWNGESWSALGSGMDGRVYSLALLGSDLYAGGYFESAGGVSAVNVARWNGSNWSPLGPGIRTLENNPLPYFAGIVTALAVSGNDLYAAGNYYTEEDDDHRVARWNGSGWTALGSLFNDHVSALAVFGSDLYAGGRFATFGGNIAKTRIGSIIKSVVTTNSNPAIQFSGVTGYQYEVQRATNLSAPINWTTLTTSPLSPASDGAFSFIDTNAPPGAAYYRARELP